MFVVSLSTPKLSKSTLSKSTYKILKYNNLFLSVWCLLWFTINFAHLWYISNFVLDMLFSIFVEYISKLLRLWYFSLHSFLQSLKFHDHFVGFLLRHLSFDNLFDNVVLYEVGTKRHAIPKYFFPFLSSMCVSSEKISNSMMILCFRFL